MNSLWDLYLDVDDAAVDGGRWGSSEVARRMLKVAVRRAEGSREVAATEAAVDDLAPRLAGQRPASVEAAERETLREARRLLGGAAGGER